MFDFSQLPETRLADSSFDLMLKSGRQTKTEMNVNNAQRLYTTIRLFTLSQQLNELTL